MIYKKLWNYSNLCTSPSTEAFFHSVVYSFYCWLKIPVCFIFFLYFCYICTNQTCNNVKICHNKYIFVQFDFPSVLSVSSMFPLFNHSFLLFFLSPFSFFEISSQCISGCSQTYCRPGWFCVLYPSSLASLLHHHTQLHASKVCELFNFFSMYRLWKFLYRHITIYLTIIHWILRLFHFSNTNAVINILDLVYCAHLFKVFW